MTLDQIFTLEPALVDLFRNALQEKPSKRYFWSTWEMYKSRLSQYVGWNARNEQLAPSDVYDEVYQALFSNYSKRSV